jgi:membrane-bound metal-dependent hydrolase YbcI (DUF457 family)
MTGPTHRQYSISFACIAAMLFFKMGITHINYYLAIPIIIMTAKSGALFPDVDHDWHNVHDKTVVNKIINFIIHATGGKHRSWQTHSADICAWFTILSYIIPNKLYDKNIISEVNKEVAIILLLGFASGWISHLFSDMLTSAGIRLFFFWNKKIKLVPRKIGPDQPKKILFFTVKPLVFNTGNEWEAFNYKAVKIINIILDVSSALYFTRVSM